MASVLVVEDNPLNMKLASLLLGSAGHTVLCAVDAEAGMALARSARPDLILMDFQLPGMSGLMATRLLKRDPATAGIPVIALTALGTKIDLESGRDAGCDAHIVKPLRYRELHRAIDILLARGAAPAVGAADSLHRADQAELSADTASRLHPHDLAGGQARSGQAVDVEILEGLIGSEPAVVLEFLQAFRIGAAAIAQELRFACASHQAVQAGRQAHKLKSSAQLAGALNLGKLCGEMEAAGRDCNLAVLLPLLPAFEGELAAVDAFLDAMLAQGSAAE